MERLAGPPEAEKGQMTLYLNGPDKTDVDLTFELKQMSIISEDGVNFDLLPAPLLINSKSVQDGQILLGQTELPTGKYTLVKITVGEAKLRTEKGISSLSLPEGPLEIPINIKVEHNENSPMFLVWDADGSLKENFMFGPEFDLQGAKADLISLLLFVSNEKSGNISVINRQSDKVVAVIETGKGPRGLAAGSRANLFKLYSANYGANSVSVIDPSTNRAESEIYIRFGRGPQDLAVAPLGDGRELLFVANLDSNNVSIIDALSGLETDRVNVGTGPAAILADPPIEEFEGSPFISPEDLRTIKDYRQSFINLYVANSLSGDISVIKVDLFTGRVAEVSPIKLESNPATISIDAQHAKLYAAHYDSEKISIINLADVINGAGGVSTIGNFGFNNVAVLGDPAIGRIYLLRQNPGEVTIVNAPGEFSGPARSSEVSRFDLLPAIGVIPVEETPSSFLLDQEDRKMYVVNTGSDSVSVINKISRLVEKRIPVGGRPFKIIFFSSSLK
jgi:YVTN family beta-propeller protein